MPTPTVYVPKRLFLPQYVALGAAVVIYTVPAGLGCQLTSLKVINTSAAGVNLNVYIVENAGVVANNRALCLGFSVPSDGLPYDLIDDAEAQFYLNVGDQIYAGCNLVNAVTIHGSGVELA